MVHLMTDGPLGAPRVPWFVVTPDHRPHFSSLSIPCFMSSSSELQTIIQTALSGNRVMARVDLDAALATLSDRADAWVWHAWLADSPAVAESSLRRALQIDPDHRTAAAGLQWVAGLLTPSPATPDSQQEPVATVDLEIPSVEETSSIEDAQLADPDAIDAEMLSAALVLDQPSVDPTPKAAEEDPSDVAADEVSLETNRLDANSIDDAAPVSASQQEAESLEAGDESETVVLPGPVAQEHVKPVAPEAIAPEAVAPEAVVSEPVVSEPVASEPVASEFIASDPSPNQPEPSETVLEQAQAMVQEAAEATATESASEPSAESPTPDETTEQIESSTKGAVAEPGDTDEPAEPANQADQGLGRLILAVDDSPTVRKLVKITLQQVGYDVVTAANGVDALNLLAKRRPALILSDINMPRLNGYQLCKLVKKHARTQMIPVLLLSGKDGIFDKLRGQMAGSCDYVTKPFESHDLIEKVRKYALRQAHAETADAR